MDIISPPPPIIVIIIIFVVDVVTIVVVVTIIIVVVVIIIIVIAGFVHDVWDVKRQVRLRGSSTTRRGCGVCLQVWAEDLAIGLYSVNPFDT